MSKQPFVNTTRSPRAFASATSATSSGSADEPRPPLPCECSARCSSERLTVATPILPTTMPAPRFASAAASRGVEARGDAGGEQRDDRVAGAGHVEHLARLRRQRQRLARPARTASCPARRA